MKMRNVWCWIDGGGRVAWSKVYFAAMPIDANLLRMRQSTFEKMEQARVNFNRATQKTRELLKVIEGMK